MSYVSEKSLFAQNLSTRCNNYGLLNGSFTDNIGVLNGKAAFIINLTLDNSYPNDLKEDVIVDLLDEILGQINLYTPVTFADGISGIGTLLNYLYRLNFINNPSSYYLDEAEDYLLNALYNGKIHHFGLERGITGLGIYFLSVICNNTFNRSDIKFLRIIEAFISVIDQLDKFWETQLATDDNINTQPWNGWQTVVPFLSRLTSIGYGSEHSRQLLQQIEEKLAIMVNGGCVSCFDKLDICFHLIASKLTSFRREKNKSIVILRQILSGLLQTTEKIPTNDLYWTILKAFYLGACFRSKDLDEMNNRLLSELYSRILSKKINDLFPYTLQIKGIDIGLIHGVSGLAICNNSILNNSYTWLEMFAHDII